ncbi:hypothetical protein ACP4OV_020663 [Aristida adscensionis]
MTADGGGGGGNDNGGGGGNGAASTGKEPTAKEPLRAQAVSGGSPEGPGLGGGSSSSTTTSSEPAGDGEEEQQQQPQAAGAKRPRLVWTTELHQKFVRACRALGPDAVPKKILGMMDVPGITRENVASHLQIKRSVKVKIVPSWITSADKLQKYRLSSDRVTMARARAVVRPKALPLQARSQAPSTSSTLHQRALSFQARYPPQTSSTSNTLHQRALHLQARSTPQAPSSSTSTPSSLHQRAVPTHGHGHFAAPPSMSLQQQQQQLGHVQVVQGLHGRYRNNAPPSFLHQRQTSLAVEQPRLLRHHQASPVMAQPRPMLCHHPASPAMAQPRPMLCHHPASPAMAQPRPMLRHHPASPAVAPPMPIPHCFNPSVFDMEAARRQKLFLEQHAAAARMQQAAAVTMQQQAAAASAGYDHMPVVVATTSYGLGGGAQAVITEAPAAGGAQAVVTGTPAAGDVQSHPPDMQASSSQDVNLSGERSVPEAGMEGIMEPSMAQMTIDAKAEAGQEVAAEPAAAAPVDPDRSNEDDLVHQLLISEEPSWGYGFPSQ